VLPFAGHRLRFLADKFACYCRNRSVASEQRGRSTTHHSVVDNYDVYSQPSPDSADRVPASRAAHLLRRLSSPGRRDQGSAYGNDRTQCPRDPGLVPEQALQGQEESSRPARLVVETDPTLYYTSVRLTDQFTCMVIHVYGVIYLVGQPQTTVML